ncbi:hypothetical protein CKO28_25795 [Rhodovibrio sodomensis]|uniref:Uncharacterized protein n=1 Tax=Rhodovibrio sodomensis TaxID=1088 RepID=A0ABS1DPL2_9PROT|nr:hypothetical protein [Rhodovibrio sodomensis]MBK1671418.1 hypothetical protein [Rhodovibrio sodomensis]
MLADVKASIDRKVTDLARAQPNPDPAIAPWARQVASVVRGIQAAEGNVLAQVIPAVLSSAPHLNVVAQPRVTLPQHAVEAVEQGVTDTAFEYTEEGAKRQLDFVCIDARTGLVQFVECKRGRHQIGADHQRARLKDDAVLELVGRSYARKQFRQIASGCRCLTISWYGKTGMPEDRTLRASELDEYYGWPVRKHVEEHLKYFRTRLDRAIPGVTGVT